MPMDKLDKIKLAILVNHGLLFDFGMRFVLYELPNIIQLFLKGLLWRGRVVEMLTSFSIGGKVKHMGFFVIVTIVLAL